ncbi:DUF302 domain-containing protein [Helicobacter kayseriensis]|uniref:DUF302 domain-containing protein n=1 Tax=Helicobacter kayseriensis TaxID=2905877 RepID=UPI001E42739F|nr:DUF302 domain-containing protein [Helicobacter kayseriensis]MCE3047724.1 DUF302 domain-containing protein [Helicobacter kayseriensis]MCE3049038.1 DUF302 domain-containing protein [Helicobacter kayseriensis]
MFRGLMIMMICIGLANAQMISEFDFQTTLQKLKQNIQTRGGIIFAEFDHSKNAQEVNLKLDPTVVVVFGNPKAGTLLMQENQAIGLELPLRIAVYQKEGKVFVSAIDIQELAQRYQIKNQKLIEKIKQMMQAILRDSTQKSQ